MTDSMTHRGPNDRGTYQRPGIALGVRRLSIVDVADGHQPFFSEDGAVGGYSERRALQPRSGAREPHAARPSPAKHAATPRSCRTSTRKSAIVCRSACEASLGSRVWDGRRRRALIARDRLGVKPLYYARCRRPPRLRFGAEESARIWARRRSFGLRGDRRLPHLRILPGPQTPLAGVAKLPPGHRLVVGDGDVRIEAYWSYPVQLPERG